MSATPLDTENNTVLTMQSDKVLRGLQSDKVLRGQVILLRASAMQRYLNERRK